ncbi:MAG: hypothetical protein Q7U78_11260, partial [Gallionella sp.]|nr:hypothetical protein [Gallionella sp.]
GSSTTLIRRFDLSPHLITIQSKGHESALCATCRQPAPDLRGFTPPPTTIQQHAIHSLITSH